VALLPLGDEAARGLLESLPEQERLASWHFVRPDEATSSRGAAGIDLLHALGHRHVAGAASRLEGPIERLYTLVAGHRDRLGHLVPDGPAPRRFP
jgi:hypothetical protein